MSGHVSVDCLKEAIRNFWDTFPDLYLAEDKTAAAPMEDSFKEPMNNLTTESNGQRVNSIHAHACPNDDDYRIRVGELSQTEQQPPERPTGMMAIGVFGVCFQQLLPLVRTETERVDAKREFSRYAAAIRDSLVELQVRRLRSQDPAIIFAK